MALPIGPIALTQVADCCSETEPAKKRRKAPFRWIFMDERGRKAHTSMARCRRRRGLGAGGQEDLDFAVIMTCSHDLKRLSAARGTTPALCHWDGELFQEHNILINQWLQRRTGDRRGRKTFQKNLLASEISMSAAVRQIRGAGIHGVWVASTSSLARKMAPDIFLALRRQKRRLT